MFTNRQSFVIIIFVQVWKKNNVHGVYFKRLVS